MVDPCMYCPAGEYDEKRCPPVCEFGKLKKEKMKKDFNSKNNEKSSSKTDKK